MAIVTFDHYKYTPEQALGPDLVAKSSAIYHNGDLTVTVEGVTQAEADEALSEHLLMAAKASKREEINSWRDNTEAGGFDWKGHRWDSDAAARERISSVAPLCLAGIDPPAGYWTDADNQDVPMTASDFVQMYTAMLTAGGNVHVRQRQMKTDIDAMSSTDLVEAYVVGA